jgi:KDO2-lipid IV(A) lauroyltransferase
MNLVGAAPLRELSDLHKRSHGVVLVGGHMGNFELAAAAVAAAGLPAAALVETIDPVRDAHFARLRTSTRLRLFPADRRGARDACQWLRSGGVLVVAGDRPLHGARRLLVPFGCGWREVPTGPAWLALKSGATLTTGYVVRAARQSPRPYEGRLEAPIVAGTVGDSPSAVAELTRVIATRLSAAAVTFADQWFVFDPAWRHAQSESS